jgi:hypothetical protein
MAHPRKAETLIPSSDQGRIIEELRKIAYSSQEPVARRRKAQNALDLLVGFRSARTTEGGSYYNKSAATGRQGYTDSIYNGE